MEMDTATALPLDGESSVEMLSSSSPSSGPWPAQTIQWPSTPTPIPESTDPSIPTLGELSHVMQQISILQAQMVKTNGKLDQILKILQPQLYTVRHYKPLSDQWRYPDF